MHIVIRDELIRDVLNELQKKRMIYLEAPCGWGKTVTLRQLQEKIGEEDCMFLHSASIDGMSFMTDGNKMQKESVQPKIFLVDNLGEWVASGRIEFRFNIRNVSTYLRAEYRCHRSCCLIN